MDKKNIHRKIIYKFKGMIEHLMDEKYKQVLQGNFRRFKSIFSIKKSICYQNTRKKDLF